MFLETDKALIDEAMSTVLKTDSENFDLIVNAMRYSALGGKRLRGILTLEFAKMFGCDIDEAMPYAVAVECIQAYSLIHDDLPCMDDDDMRRGKPSCHIAFGEANALLAGDALLTHAFNVISDSKSAEKHPERAIKAVKILSEYAGFKGMVGGQVLDLEAAEKITDFETMDLIHKLKTGALIKASVLMGCAAAGVNSDLCKISGKYAEEFGYAFQIIDDILDFDGNYETCELNSYVKIHGLEKAKEAASARIENMSATANEIASQGFDASSLNFLVDYLTKRMEK